MGSRLIREKNLDYIHKDKIKATILEPNIIDKYRVPRKKMIFLFMTSKALWLSTVACVLLCHHFISTYNIFIYSLFIMAVMFPIQYHLASYESFRNTHNVLLYLRHSRTGRDKFLQIINGTTTFNQHQYANSHHGNYQSNCETNTSKNSTANADLEQNNDNDKLLRLSSPVKKIVRLNLTDRLYRCEYNQVGVSHLWLNKIVQCCWPYLAQYMQDEIEKLSSDNPNGIQLDNGNQRIKFEQFQLGHTAPVIKKITLNKEGLRKDELVFDVKLLYNGDFIMSILYRYLYFFSSRAGIKDVFLRINMRIQLRPIVDSPPFIGGLSVSLLDLPTINYTGLNLGEMAELKFVRTLFMNLISAYLLQPESISIPLVKPANLLAQELMVEAKSECVKSMKRQIMLFRAGILSKNRRARNRNIRKWSNKKLEGIRKPLSKCNIRATRDSDLSFLAPSKFAGTLATGRWNNGKKANKQLSKLKTTMSKLTQKQQDDLMKITTLSTKNNDNLLINDWEREVRCPIPIGICLIHLIEAVNLPLITNTIMRMFQPEKPNSFCSVLIGKHLFKTPIAHATINPFWGYSFAAPVHDLYDRIKLSTHDKKKFCADRPLGNVEFSIASMLKSSSCNEETGEQLVNGYKKLRNGSDCWLRLKIDDASVNSHSTINKLQLTNLDNFLSDTNNQQSSIDINASYIHIRLAFAPLDTKWKLYNLDNMEAIEVCPPIDISYSPRLLISELPGHGFVNGGKNAFNASTRKVNLYNRMIRKAGYRTKKNVNDQNRTIALSRKHPFPSAIVTLYLDCVDRFNDDVIDCKHYKSYAPHLEVYLNNQKYTHINCDKYDKDLRQWPIKRQLNLLSNDVYEDVVNIRFKSSLYYNSKSTRQYNQRLRDRQFRMANIGPIINLPLDQQTTISSEAINDQATVVSNISTVASSATDSDSQLDNPTHSVEPAKNRATASSLPRNKQEPTDQKKQKTMSTSLVDVNKTECDQRGTKPIFESLSLHSSSMATTTSASAVSTASNSNDVNCQISSKHEQGHSDDGRKSKRFLTRIALKYLEHKGLDPDTSLYLSPNKIVGNFEGELKLELKSLFDYSLPQLIVHRRFDITVTSKHKILLTPDSSYNRDPQFNQIERGHSHESKLEPFKPPRLQLFASLRFVRPERKTLQNLAKPLMVLNLNRQALLDINKRKDLSKQYNQAENRETDTDIGAGNTTTKATINTTTNVLIKKDKGNIHLNTAKKIIADEIATKHLPVLELG